MNIPIYQVDAFAEKPFEGNPAAVCPLDKWLPDETLQAIASENNLSETAFFIPRDDCYDLRWFTPVSEVDLCGHATLASAHVVFSKYKPNRSKILFKTRSGSLPVSRDGERLTLDFPAQPGVKCPTPDPLLKSLGITPIECYQSTDLMAVFDNQARRSSRWLQISGSSRKSTAEASSSQRRAKMRTSSVDSLLPDTILTKIPSPVLPIAHSLPTGRRYSDPTTLPQNNSRTEPACCDAKSRATG